MGLWFRVFWLICCDGIVMSEGFEVRSVFGWLVNEVCLWVQSGGHFCVLI